MRARGASSYLSRTVLRPRSALRCTIVLGDVRIVAVPLARLRLLRKRQLNHPPLSHLSPLGEKTTTTGHHVARPTLPAGRGLTYALLYSSPGHHYRPSFLPIQFSWTTLLARRGLTPPTITTDHHTARYTSRWKGLTYACLLRVERLAYRADHGVACHVR